MAKITIEREGQVVEVIEVEGYLAAGLGEKTEEGVHMHQMLIAENIGERDLIRLLTTVVGTFHKVFKDSEIADAVIASSVAKAKLDHLLKDDGEEAVPPEEQV